MTKPTVLVVEDDEVLQQALCDTLKLAGYEVRAANDGKAALDVLADHEVGLVVSDVKMERMNGYALLKQIKTHSPNIHVLMMTAYGSIEQAVSAMRDGAVDYLVKPFEAEVLVNTVSRYLSNSAVACGEVVFGDPATQQLLDIATRVADSDATVMITGESGTGKEVLARYLHRHSLRSDEVFVAINCAAIPDNMLEATLFGYEKGAFTGAYNASPGKFEQAQNGTLLLDEISEMNAGLQAKLLRVIQEKEVERLGGRKMINLDVRVLATTNRNLRDEISAGRFREDLYYRLNVFPLHIQALRNRLGDILPISQHLLEKYAGAASRPIPTLTTAAQNRLLKHRWPGNVRELDNLLQRALILQTSDRIKAEDLHFEPETVFSFLGGEGPAAAPPAPSRDGDLAEVEEDYDRETDTLGGDLKSVEDRLIIDALAKVQGRRKEAAAQLGISQRTLRYKLARMRKSGIIIPGVGAMTS